MATSPLDDQIDHLYQVSLDEFTAARNGLAKESGDGAIKKLEKPNLAAWAVNQLYWHERKLYDEVVKTSTQVRTAHRQMLSGKASDVPAAETFHAEAMRKAKGAIRRMLQGAGNSAADAVMTPVTETLDALPTTDSPGRLVRPLRRTGFEALQGITAKAAPPVPKIEPRKPAAQKESEKDRDKDRRKREADQQELAMVKERLRFAEAAEREAEASVDRADRAVERSERTRERIEAELAEATEAEKSLRKEQAAAAAALERARKETARLRSRLK